MPVVLSEVPFVLLEMRHVLRFYRLYTHIVSLVIANVSDDEVSMQHATTPCCFKHSNNVETTTKPKRLLAQDYLLWSRIAAE